MRADWFVPALAAHVPRLAQQLAIDCRIARPAVALTFDDGPHAEGTPAVLDVLAQRGATATFFLVGEQVRAHRALAREIADAGHEIALHGDRHTLLLRRRVAELADDLRRATAELEDTTGRTPALYRPPYGVFSAGALALVRSLGLVPLLWSRWGRDWERRATPSKIAARATRGLRPGDVVLLHDSDAYSSSGSWSRTAAALPSVIDAIADLDVPAVSVTQST
ncbi:MAG TPA: polysaccharide deacetylase family protein [Gaiellaceae bacterium]|nr:polysaccharide deacetylase family protein [Gaiellaceae bacterium]